MKRFIIILISTLYLINNNLSQPCLPEGITFTTQEQIENFQINYPGCTEIEGNVHIGDTIFTTSINSLDSLNCITSIGGNLSIMYNESLGALEGLNTLSSIAGDLIIYGNDSLTTTEALHNLGSIGGSLSIKYNDNLQNLSGFENLSFVNNTVYIGNCESISSFIGLESLDSIGSCLYIYGLHQISNLDGLNNLEFIGDCLVIGYNSNLNNLYGINNLHSIGGPLIIYANDALISLEDLSNIISIEGQLTIENNDALQSLFGLDNLNPNSISDLKIIWNDNLSNCDIQSICEYLVDPGGTITIHENAIGCNSSAEVEEACLTGQNEFKVIENNFIIYPNPANKEFLIISKSGETIIDINIYNQVGKKVLHKKGTSQTFDVTTLRQGIYIIELLNVDSEFRAKLIIK